MLRLAVCYKQDQPKMKETYPALQKCLLLTIYLCLSCSLLHGQQSWSDMKNELKKLDGPQYISVASKYAEELALQKKFDESYDLLKKTTRKARSMGQSVHIVVLAHRAELIADYFPLNDKYAKDLVESLREISKLDPPDVIVDQVDMILKSTMGEISGKYKNDLVAMRHDIDQYISERNGDKIVSSEQNRRDDILKLNKEEAFEEIEKLKYERQRLEGLQLKLSETVRNNEKQLNRRTRMINEMNADQAQKEALLEFNKRMIDSLRFISELDSMNLLSQENLINRQEAELNLTNSTLLLQESQLKLKSSQQRLYIILAIAGLLIGGIASWLSVLVKKSNNKLEKKNKEIEEEKERSEKLLLNILPKDIATELKANSKVQTRKFEECTVCFTDFINFSRISQMLTPEDLIAALDECFKAFDEIISIHNVEKIKTIGDSYMCAAGVPITNKSHATDAVKAAIEMVAFLEEWNTRREAEGLIRFDARIGIHTGPIIAGVVGIKKFAYDIWGDTVNVAARMESKSEAQRINISQSTYELIKEEFSCHSRGSLDVKNMKNLEMYYVDTISSVPSLN